MLEAFEFLSGANEATELLVELTFEERQKSRHRATTSSGETLGWFIERGVVLADGDILVCKGGEKVKVVAALETVSNVKTEDALALTRAAYHLGNRHVPLQITNGELRYQHDHVLDDMVRGLGLKVESGSYPFHPESGAYSHGHSHGHSHAHEH